MSQYKELADTLEWLAEGYWEAEIRKAIAILRSLDAQEPMFWYRPTCNGEMYEGPVHANSVGGKMLRDEKPDEWMPLYAAPVAAQPPFAKGSWQHAVDDQLVSFGRTSQEFDSPHDAVRWLIEQEVQLDIARADLAAQPQQAKPEPLTAKPLSDEEIAFCIFESKMKNPAITRDGTTSIRIARAAITAFCQKNGIKEHP